MNKPLKSSPVLRILTSGRFQLNVIGVVLLAILGWGAWQISHPLTLFNIMPLAILAYAAWRILFELTWNRKQIPTLATSMTGRKKITEILQSEALRRTGQKFQIIDLGSGRGELARRIARAIPAAEVIGIEQARIPYLQACAVQRLFGPGNLSFKSLDFWSYDCTDASAVLLYLNQRLAHQVGEKLAKEMRPGGVVISHTFPLQGAWVPDEIIEFRTPFKETIYVYRKIAPVRLTPAPEPPH